MAKKLVTSYTFDASAKTVASADFTSLEKIQLITNVTDQIIIYNFADPTKGGSLTSTTLTLVYDTTSMADADKLQIFVDDTTQPVSGTALDAIETATEAIQAAQLPDGHNVTIDNTSIAVTGTFWQATQPVSGSVTVDMGANNDVTVTSGSITANAGTNLNTSALALEAGNLASIKAKTDNIPALGQALAAGSLPVVLPTAQITTLTPPAAITGFATSAKQLADNHQVTVSNIASTPVISGFATDTKQSDGSQKTQIVDAGGEAVTVTGGKLDVNASVDTTGLALAANQLPDGHNVTVDNASLAVTAAALPLPSGAATSAKQDTVIGHVDGIETLLGTIDADTSTLAGTDFATEAKQDAIITAIGAIPGGSGVQYTEGDTDASITGTASLVEGAANALAVLTQPLTDTQLRATAVPVSGTFYQATQPVSGTVTANAGTNLNTSALALEAGGNLAAIKAKTDNIPAQGQALAAASLPVVLPADQITTLTPPAAISGFATSAKQDTIIGHVDGIETVLGTIDADTSTIAGAVSAGHVQVDVLTTPTTAVTGTFWQATQPISGTVTANATLAAETTKVIGTVNIAAAQTIGITANSSVNIAQMNGVTTTMGNGASGTGVQRVTIASDSTGQVKLAAGTAGIGKLTANSGVDIGDVDILSIATGTNAIGRVGHDVTGIGHGVKTVTTAGTHVALAASTACKKVDIQAQTDNTNIIAVGGSGVDATIATGTGVVLYPGETYSLEIDNLADIYIDSLVNGEGVRYTYFT